MCHDTMIPEDLSPEETQTPGVQTNPQPRVRFELALYERMVVSQCSPCTQLALSLLFLLEVCMPSMAIYFKGFDEGLRVDEHTVNPSQLYSMHGN